MNHAENTEAFEQVLLSHVEMCYLVALSLTHSPRQGQELTRHVLLWAWRLRESMHGQKHIKKVLLCELRKRFLENYQVGFVMAPVLAENA